MKQNAAARRYFSIRLTRNQNNCQLPIPGEIFYYQEITGLYSQLCQESWQVCNWSEMVEKKLKTVQSFEQRPFIWKFSQLTSRQTLTDYYETQYRIVLNCFYINNHAKGQPFYPPNKLML
jgi:hypothetical protein